MEHLIKINPTHCRHADGSALLGEVPAVNDRLTYRYGLEIPHMLNYHSGVLNAIICSGTLIRPGDIVRDEFQWRATVTEVEERRKARGDWSNNPFDEEPDFVRLRLI